MIIRIKNWFTKKVTLIIAPSSGGRSFHVSFSNAFSTFILLIFITIFSVGSYFSYVYLSYLQAMDANKRLIREKNEYTRKVEETLNILHKMKNIETRLHGMLGMKTTRNIIENYKGGPNLKDLNIPIELEDIYDKARFDANVNEVKREAWLQSRNYKKIASFVDKKKNFLLSTPSIWPVFGYITSSYGWRTNPITKRREFHKALDMYSIGGKQTPIRATARGRVVVAGWAGSLGRVVIVDHGSGFSTRYAHCSKLLVKQGERIVQGQIVGYIGSTGRSTGPHLHYEVWYRGKPVNPSRFLKGR